jgi:hypothetical protein
MTTWDLGAFGIILARDFAGRPLEHQANHAGPSRELIT